jgi:hypothetical protein
VLTSPPGLLNTRLSDDTRIARTNPDLFLPHARVQPTHKRHEARRKQEEESGRGRR